MKKELRWEVQLGGEMHTILCVLSDNGYDLYDGDDHITKVYMKSFMHNLRGGVERDIDINGHTVKFVAWDRYNPDIVANGMMIGGNISYEEAHRQYGKAKFTVFAVGLALCGIMFGGAVPQIFLAPDKAVMYAVDAAAFLAGGLFCMRQLFKLR